MQHSAFDWQRQPAAETFCLDTIARLLNESAVLRGLEEKIREQTSGRLIEWIDHLVLPASDATDRTLRDCGFVRRPGSDGRIWRHPGALLPGVVTQGARQGVAIRAKSVAEFLQIHRLAGEIEGGPFAPYRRARVREEERIALLAVERRATLGCDPAASDEGYLRDYFGAIELWQSRPRTGADEEADFGEAERRVEAMVGRLGPDLAAHVVCLCERRYWYVRNGAARVQKGRQDALGLGWGNQDHHTFRSSRRHFTRLVALFERLGFHRRERFYAGDEAGWGAQLMENDSAGLTLFLDVDLAPEEIAADFGGEPLPEREELGTVGLWCALHGDSILGAGMHHLAARFHFERLADDLSERGIAFMAPFSNFSYLKQAFSIAERWRVEAPRLQRLVRDKILTEEQADTFHAKGAVGSHLENIERNEGYKGFNKKNVSLIIRQTDPRSER